MFKIYRNNFATVDTFNKVALGPKSVVHTVKVKNRFKRVFQCMIAICETNAYYAFVATNQVGNTGFAMSRELWKLNLANRLVSNPFTANPELPLVRSAPEEATHDCLYYVKGENKRCKVCHKG